MSDLTKCLRELYANEGHAKCDEAADELDKFEQDYAQLNLVNDRLAQYGATALADVERGINRIAALEADLAAAQTLAKERRFRIEKLCGMLTAKDSDLAAAQSEASAERIKRECAERRLSDHEAAIRAAVAAEREALTAKIALAYGHLWHVNNEPAAPIPIYTPEKAAYEARKILRDTLTSEQRGDAINATQQVWGSARGAAHE